MTALLLLATAMFGRNIADLPNGWTPFGAEFSIPSKPDARYTMALWGSNVVDETGRFMYCRSCRQWDFATGKTRDFYISRQLISQDPSKWSVKLCAKWGEEPDTWDFLLARGTRLFGTVVGSMPWFAKWGAFDLQIAGEAKVVDFWTGDKPLVESGLDFVLTNTEWFLFDHSKGWKRRFPSPEGDYPRFTGTYFVVHGQHIEKFQVRRKGKAFFSRGLPGHGCVRWRQGKVYLSGGENALACQVDFRNRPITARWIPFDGESNRPVAVLANGTVCAQVDQHIGAGAEAHENCVAKIFDTDTWKWHDYPGLMILGSSNSGKFVTYRWISENKIHLARVSGSE